MTADELFMLGVCLLCVFTAGAWWGARQEHGNWLNSARVGTSQRGSDGVFYRVDNEGAPITCPACGVTAGQGKP